MLTMPLSVGAKLCFIDSAVRRKGAGLRLSFRASGKVCVGLLISTKCQRSAVLRRREPSTSEVWAPYTNSFAPDRMGTSASSVRSVRFVPSPFRPFAFTSRLVSPFPSARTARPFGRNLHKSICVGIVRRGFKREAFNLRSSWPPLPARAGRRSP